MYEILSEILKLAKSELNENKNIGYTMPDGKHHLFIWVDDSLGGDDLYYVIEPNKVVNGAHEPIGDNSAATYNDFSELLLNIVWVIERYF